MKYKHDVRRDVSNGKWTKTCHTQSHAQLPIQLLFLPHCRGQGKGRKLLGICIFMPPCFITIMSPLSKLLQFLLQNVDATK